MMFNQEDDRMAEDENIQRLAISQGGLKRYSSDGSNSGSSRDGDRWFPK
jgi:hypothetical protein